MKLGEKIRHLRYAEGMLRGLGRELSQMELVRAARKELGQGISQSYLSQIESGARPHLTNRTRELLARFFKVHPGFLVDDPEGFHTALLSSLPERPGQLELWLHDGARRLRRDGELSAVLEKLAHGDDVRRGLILLGAILDTPGLVSRLLHVLRPTQAEDSQDFPQTARHQSVPRHRGEEENSTHPQRPQPDERS